MSLGYGLGDVVAAAKLAWVLYHDCYLVARDAPDDFRDLVSELASLQSILRSLRDEINSDPAYLERVGEHRKQAIERTVDGTFRTLKGLEKLVRRYHALGMNEGLNFWKRIKWASSQRDIAGFRQKIMVHGTTLNLCLSSVGNSTLLRIEQRFGAALELNTASSIDESSQAEPARDAIGPSSPSTFLRFQDPLEPQSKIRAGSDHLLSEVGARRSSEPARFHAPSQASDDTPSTTPASSVTPSTYLVFDAKVEDSDLLISTHLDDLRVGPIRPKSSAVTNVMDLETQGTSNLELLAVMSDAKNILSSNHRNQLANPHMLFPFHERHERIDIPEVLAERFRASVSLRRQIRPDGLITAKDWLRIATWWVIKSRAIVALDAASTPNASINSRLNASLTLRQAHINLLKACWIMYEMILANDGMRASLTDENRALFWTLENAVVADFDRFQASSETSALLQDFAKHDLILWEHLQPMEERLTNPVEMHEDPALDPGRWITCDSKNAGFEDERVLFRCFANSAGIGLRQLRVETDSAPYLVVIWTKGGESEMRITFCNQSGSLNLTRDCTWEVKCSDIVSLVDAESRALGPPPVHLNFPGMPVTIYFLQLSDFEQFMSIPKRFFDAVHDREPREHEYLIHRVVAETYERRNPVSSHSVVPQELYSSCELRIFETRGEHGWDTTRRLVITGSADEANPWCISHFLPLCHVAIRNEDDEMEGRFVTMKWSDCSQRTTNTHGTRVDHVSYIYDPVKPNICAWFSFDSSSEARQFVKAILTMSSKVDYSWPKSTSDAGSRIPQRAVYNMSVKYRSLFVTFRRNGWHWGELYHIPRELDFQLSPRRPTDRYADIPSDNGLELKILTAFTTDYISNHVDRVDEPSTAPCFSHCENRLRSVTVDIEQIIEAQELMKAMTVKWHIKAIRAHAMISLEVMKSSGLSLFSRRSYSHEKHELAELSIWERSAAAATDTATARNDILERRVLVRWSSPSSKEKTWLTATVIAPGYIGGGGHFPSMNPHDKSLIDSEKALLQVKDAVRGKLIDVVNMMSVAGKAKQMPQSPKSPSGGVAGLKIKFATARDKEDFARESGLML